MNTHPHGSAATGPSRDRPPSWLRRAVASTVVAVAALAVTVPAGASSTAADMIECWIPQAAGWVPPTVSEIEATRPPAYVTFYKGWIQHDVRFRQWDQRYEIITRTDRATAPFCSQVLPGSDWFVYSADLPAVRLYLSTLLP